MRAATTAIACTPRTLCGRGQQQNVPIFSRWVGFLAYILGLPNNHLRGRTEPQLRDLLTTIRRVTVLFIFLGDWSNQVPTATGNQVHTAACMVFQFAVDGMFFSSMWMGSDPWLGCSYVVSWMKSMSLWRMCAFKVAIESNWTLLWNRVFPPSERLASQVTATWQSDNRATMDLRPQQISPGHRHKQKTRFVFIPSTCFFICKCVPC